MKSKSSQTKSTKVATPFNAIEAAKATIWGFVEVVLGFAPGKSFINLPLARGRAMEVIAQSGKVPTPQKGPQKGKVSARAILVWVGLTIDQAKSMELTARQCWQYALANPDGEVTMEAWLASKQPSRRQATPGGRKGNGAKKGATNPVTTATISAAAIANLSDEDLATLSRLVMAEEAKRKRARAALAAQAPTTQAACDAAEKAKGRKPAPKVDRKKKPAPSPVAARKQRELAGSAA